jgi:Tol biopolymer transport system component
MRGKLAPVVYLSVLLAGAALGGCGGSAARGGATTAAQAPRAPELYGAGLFSTGAWDFFVAFSPDQKRALFGRADDAFEQFDLYETRQGAGGRWSRPERPRFARAWSNADPHFSPDGSRVFFISNRPHAGETAERPTHDIWTVSLQDGEWSDAERLPAPVNDAALDEWSPAVAASGNLYFGADRPGTRGGSDLWVSRPVDGAYSTPENLGDAINSPAHEVEAWIAPDESYLVFSALRRAGGLGGYDLYLSRRRAGRWEKATPLPRPINSAASDWNHSVSPDGRWLYFTSTRPLAVAVGQRLDTPRDDGAVAGIGNGKGDMYRVPMSALGL